MSETGGPEHDFEPVAGLPGDLPPGEHIVWQGAPRAGAVSRRVLKTHWIAAYFAVLVVWALISGFYDGRSAASVLFSGGALMIMGTVAIAILEAFAWGVRKTTLYTITNKRVVMRIGVALSATFNLPFTQIISADVRADEHGNGDIALTLAPGHRLSLFAFWPHFRGWRKGGLMPQMIGLADAGEVADILSLQLVAHAGRRHVASPAASDGAGARPTAVPTAASIAAE